MADADRDHMVIHAYCARLKQWRDAEMVRRRVDGLPLLQARYDIGRAVPHAAVGRADERTIADQRRLIPAGADGTEPEMLAKSGPKNFLVEGAPPARSFC